MAAAGAARGAGGVATGYDGSEMAVAVFPVLGF